MPNEIRYDIYTSTGMCHTAYSYNTPYRINAYFTVLNKLGRILYYTIAKFAFFPGFGFCRQFPPQTMAY